jgi:hypothetical protein
MLESRRGKRAETIQLFQELNRTFANFLSSLRLYRDHALTRLAHSYGRQSAERSYFDRSWSDAVRQDFAFGFIWEFRNYVQHFGMPFDVASVSIEVPPEPGAERRAHLGISLGALLRYERWGRLDAEIRKLPETVPVQDYVEPAMRKLAAIDLALAEQERPALTLAGNTVVRLLRSGFEGGAYAGTMEVSDESPPIGLVGFHLAPVEVLGHLGLLDATETPDGPRTRLIAT